MISNKDLRVEGSNLIINGEKHPLDPAVEALTKRANTVQGKFSALDTKLDAIEALEKTASGNPISLTGVAAAYAMSNIMTIEPIQDLHGYSKPWSAGAGKNKCNATTITAECAADGIVSEKIGEITLTETTSILLSFEQNKTIGSVQRNTLVLRVPNTTTDYFPTNVTQPGLNAGYHDGLIENMPAGTYDVRMWLQVPDIAVSVTNFMVRDASIIDNTFEPYSNICPISGLSSGEVETTDGTDTNTAAITLGQTVYGGSVNFKTGEVTVTHANIASYNGESINEPWLSSLDKYESGATPTTGAQVVYPLSTPITLTLTPAELELLKGNNTVSGNGANINLSYIGR